MANHSSAGMSILCTLEGTDTMVEIRIPFVVAVDYQPVVCASETIVFNTVFGPRRTSYPALVRAVTEARRAGKAGTK